MARVSYLLIQTFKEKQNEREKLRGVFQMLDGNVLMLVHPSSGDNIFYKVRDINSIILIDSFGNEPKKEDRKSYTLKKKGLNTIKLCQIIIVIVWHSLIIDTIHKFICMVHCY